MPYRFVDDIMKNMIDKLITNEFPSMIIGDINIIKKYFVAFIETLAHNFKLSDNPFMSDTTNATSNNKYELSKENNLNLRWLLYYQLVEFVEIVLHLLDQIDALPFYPDYHL